LSLPLFASFLRSNREYQKCFQVCRDCHGRPHYLKAEVLFHYEHSSNYRIADKTFEKLLAEVADDDFVGYELPGRIRCDRLEEFIASRAPDLSTPQGRATLKSFFEAAVPDAGHLADKLSDFLCTAPRLPGTDKSYVAREPIEIPVDCTRQEVIEYLHAIRGKNATADLAFYAYRDMETSDWTPFITAAVSRNPVSLDITRDMSTDELCAWLEQMDDTSIYHGPRLAQPDEVANYKTADGLEKAFLLANVMRNRHQDRDIQIAADGPQVTVTASGRYYFESTKGLTGRAEIPAGKYPPFLP